MSKSDKAVKKTQDKENVFIREVTAHYRRGKRTLQRVNGPEAVREFAVKVERDNSREHFLALFLDGGHQVVSYSIVFTGTAVACPVHPREIFQHAVLAGAVSIIIAHNHPSGTLTPSEEDTIITQKLVEAGHLIGIPLLDHVIFSDEGFFSFQQTGML